MYQRLLNICKEKGTTITSLCLQATGNKGNLQTWKNNNGHMRSDYLLNCADILDCSTDYILGREKENSIDIKSVHNNHGIIGHTHAPVTIINGTEKKLSEQELTLLDIFSKFDVIKQAQLLSYAAELKKEI